MRLIDADALKAYLRELGWITDDPFAELGDLEEIVDNAPTVERPHGKWNMDEVEKVEMYIRECSHCKTKGAVGKFCMWCGAKMETEVVKRNE